MSRFPTVLTAKNLAEIVKMRKKGIKITTICKVLSISRESYNKWMGQGRELFQELSEGTIKEEELDPLEELFLEFYLKSEHASGMFEVEQHEKIRKSRGWQASAWLLERHSSENYLKPSEEKESGGTGNTGNGLLESFISYVDSVAKDTIENDEDYFPENEIDRKTGK